MATVAAVAANPVVRRRNEDRVRLVFRTRKASSVGAPAAGLRAGKEVRRPRRLYSVASRGRFEAGAGRPQVPQKRRHAQEVTPAGGVADDILHCKFLFREQSRAPRN